MKAFRFVILLLLCLLALPGQAQRRYMNDKVLNRPYADLRRWHLGFSIGMHVENLLFQHNGFVTETGQEWMIEQPDYTPGFCVNGLIDFRLGRDFALRFNPGLYFGSRDLRMLEITTGLRDRQSLKSAYVVLPIDVKYAAQRMRNMRPYVTGGIMPAFDVSKKQNEYIQLKSTDFFLTVGFGCDFYLPYFKLIPELKFCFGLTDALQHNRPDLADDPYKLQFTQSLSKATTKMVVLSFYFE